MNRISLALVALVASASIASAASYVPYTGMGDPDGIVSGHVDQMSTGSIGDVNYVPYSGFGDPADLLNTDQTITGSVPARGTQVPYTGLGDPDDLV
jgi:hypothetical protein